MWNVKNINVYLPDSSSKIFDVESKTVVRDLIIRIADSYNLVRPSAIYGLYHKDEGGNKYWLVDDDNLSSQKVLNSSVECLNLYFSFKYIADIASLKEDRATKYFFYHHLKESIYCGDLEIRDSDLCFRLIAMTVVLNDEEIDQTELRSKIVKIIPRDLYERHPSIDYCTQKIIEHYDFYSETNSSELMSQFVDTVINLPYHLIHYFPVQDSTGTSVTLGVGKNGLIECDASSKSICHFRQSWSEINHVTYSKVKLIINNQTGTFNKFRRESSATSLSYKTANSHLAKSITCLCNDTVNFNYQMSDSSLSSNNNHYMSNNRTKVLRSFEKTTPSTLKKSQNLNNSSLTSIRSNNSEGSNPSLHNNTFNSVSSHRRSSVSSAATNNTFGEDHSLTNGTETAYYPSRSPSHMSISSNQDACTIERQSVCSATSGGKSWIEQQQKFEELQNKQLQLENELARKEKELNDLFDKEVKITGEKPADYDKYYPNKVFLTTKCPVGTKFISHQKNKSAYEEKKAEKMLAIETLMNIIQNLNKNSHKKEIKCKQKQIQKLEEELKDLERSNAFAQINPRSSSMGNLHQISARNSNGFNDYDTLISGSHTLKRPSVNDNNNNQSQIEKLSIVDGVSDSGGVSMATEPLSRRRNTNPSFVLNDSIEETYPGITDAPHLPNSSHKAFHFKNHYNSSTITPVSSHNYLRHSPHYQSSPRSLSRRQQLAANNSNFHRFASARTPISYNSFANSVSSNSVLSGDINTNNHHTGGISDSKNDASVAGSDNNLSSSSSSNVDSNASDISDMHFDSMGYPPYSVKLQNIEIDEIADAPTPTIKHHNYSSINRSTRTISRTNQTTNSHVNVIRRPHFPRNHEYDQEFEHNPPSLGSYRDSCEVTKQQFKVRKFRSPHQPPSPLVGRARTDQDSITSVPNCVYSPSYDRRNTQMRSNTPTARSRRPDLRRSVSLEEIKPSGEEEIDNVPEPLSEKDVTAAKPPIRSRLYAEPPKLTIRPSKRDVIPLNLTRGRQPSIIRKSAKPSPTII